MSSKWYGKLSTILFYLAIVFSWIILYLTKEKYNLDINFIITANQYIYYLAVTSTVFSFIMYFKAFYMKGYLNKINK